MADGYYFDGYFTPEEGRALGLASAYDKEQILSEWEWNGEYKLQHRIDYWCPTEERWVECSGTETCKHEYSMPRIVELKVMVRKGN
jgi:hypothetical protein